jgi:hypothetical protein
MVATVRQFRSRADKAQASKTQQLRQLLLDLEPLLPSASVGEVLNALPPDEADESDPRFIMLYIEDFNAVADWLEEHSCSPRVASRLLRQMLRFVHPTTQEILRSREELAELVGCTPREVSRVMQEMVSIQAVRRERRPVEGVRGPGVVRWYVNPRLGTHLPREARRVARANAPDLHLVERAPE